MDINFLNDETFLKINILNNFDSMIDDLKTKIDWDNSIKSRRTASFGLPYNYSNINYDKKEIPTFLQELINVVHHYSGFFPNNCLINYYYDSLSKMGYHSDQIDILEKDTGIAIFSFGSTRILRFKNKFDDNLIFDFELKNNSYFYMSQEIQKYWLHSILKDNTNSVTERFSITFRRISV